MCLEHVLDKQAAVCLFSFVSNPLRQSVQWLTRSVFFSCSFFFFPIMENAAPYSTSFRLYGYFFSISCVAWFSWEILYSTVQFVVPRRGANFLRRRGHVLYVFCWITSSVCVVLDHRYEKNTREFVKYYFVISPLPPPHINK